MARREIGGHFMNVAGIFKGGRPLFSPLSLKCETRNYRAQRFYRNRSWRRREIGIDDDGPWDGFTLRSNRRRCRTINRPGRDETACTSIGDRAFWFVD